MPADRDALLADLAVVTKQLIEALAAIENQKVVIANQAAGGKDTADGMALLDQLRQALLVLEDRRRAILKQLTAGAASVG
jgi:hypothetical protein